MSVAEQKALGLEVMVNALRDAYLADPQPGLGARRALLKGMLEGLWEHEDALLEALHKDCLLYTSHAADE